MALVYGELIKSDMKKEQEEITSLNEIAEVELSNKGHLFANVSLGLNEGPGYCHFHITSNGRKICICIFKAAYFPHKDYLDKFSTNEEKEFDKFMKSPVGKIKMIGQGIKRDYEAMILKGIINLNTTVWEFLARYFFTVNPKAFQDMQGFDNLININNLIQTDYSKGLTKVGKGNFRR